MTIDSIHEVVERHVSRQNYQTILDIGGWFIPYPRATHVVDLMPWETRGGKLNLARLPEEMFTKDTWVAMDVCDPAMKLPFPDKYFDCVVCGGTLEDLPDPAPCIAEIRRVGKRGYIRVPTMTCELTVGVEDRANNVIGYFHHHWICQSPASNNLVMASKEDAGLGLLPGHHIPLRTFERSHRTEPLNSLHLFWEDDLSVTFLRGEAASELAHSYIASLKISPRDYVEDAAFRFARRARSRLRGNAAFENSKSAWWNQMLQISKPYSDPALHRRAGGSY